MTTKPGNISLASLREKRSEILSVASRRKATNVRVFGSVVRGDNTVGSDIDFLVTMAPDATLIDLIALEQDLAALLGQEVDVATEDALSPVMRDNPQATSVRL